MIIYESAHIYITKDKDLRTRICNIDKVIDALTDSALKAAGTANLGEYDLDNGQTKIKTTYRNPTDITNAITAFEKVKQLWINQLNGRAIRLVDEKNFRRNRFGYGYQGF
ncbi:MAG TPA: hypothetical protein VN922_20935 [Bacteroidia bacterium]|nr:hypothetical protein [Bacteroidia bacterium]